MNNFEELSNEEIIEIDGGKISGKKLLWMSLGFMGAGGPISYSIYSVFKLGWENGYNSANS